MCGQCVTVEASERQSTLIFSSQTLSLDLAGDAPTSPQQQRCRRVFRHPLLPKPSYFPPSPSLPLSLFPFHQSRRTAHIALSRRGLTSRTRRPEKRGRDRGDTEDGVLVKEEMRVSSTELGGEGGENIVYSTDPPPALPELEQDFWEGPQWDALVFFVQYLWAFGIVFGVIACGIAVTTNKEGAIDFKQTTVYKESIQSRELLEQPDGSNGDVFKGNPTEVAPSLE